MPLRQGVAVVFVSLGLILLLLELKRSGQWRLEQRGLQNSLRKASSAESSALRTEIAALRSSSAAAELVSETLRADLDALLKKVAEKRDREDEDEVEKGEHTPHSSAIDFGCSVPSNQRLQAGCWLRGARGNYTGERTPKGGLVGGRSQTMEDKYLFENFFYKRTGGTFLEMGALDGLMYSNTYFFENEANWTGMMIEGSPKNFAALVRNRPDTINLNAMICESDTKLHWIESGNAIGGAWEFMPQAFRKEKHGDLTAENVAKLPTVPCVSLANVLARFGIQHVDLLSLDVEGAEASVLKTIDFDKFSASVILVEVKPGQENPRPLLSDAGYIDHGPAGPNRVYIHPRFLETL